MEPALESVNDAMVMSGVDREVVSAEMAGDMLAANKIVISTNGSVACFIRLPPARQIGQWSRFALDASIALAFASTNCRALAG